MEKSRSRKKRVSIAGMHIDRASAVPIYLQIAAHLRNGILQGSLPAGTQFLGSREIARELGCSRTVILTAWDLLYAVSSVRPGNAAVTSGTSGALLNGNGDGAQGGGPNVEIIGRDHLGSDSTRQREFVEVALHRHPAK
jgi:DNA-binding transcriptional MocR family regulator